MTDEQRSNMPDRHKQGESLEQRLGKRSEVIRETREASQRAEGGGDPDEVDIARTAREEDLRR